MALFKDININATASFRGFSKAQMSFGRNLTRRHDEGLGDESLAVVRKLERRGLLNIDLNVAPPEAADFDLAADHGNEPETPPLADASAKKGGKSDEGGVNFNAEMKGRKRRWVALLGVAESALREKKEEEIRSRKRILVEERCGEVAEVVRSTRGRAVAMPKKYSDSVLDPAEAELLRHSRNRKSATVFCTNRKSR